MSCSMLLVVEQASFPRILLSKPTRWVTSADSSTSHETKDCRAALFLRDIYSTFFLFFLILYAVPGLVFLRLLLQETQILVYYICFALLSSPHPQQRPGVLPCAFGILTFLSLSG